MPKIVIIGGGVAGLSAANKLSDLGEEPILIEKGDYSKEKVCGEFLSPESLPILQNWGIVPNCYIHETRFFKKNSLKVTFPLVHLAGSMPRTQLEKELLKRARSRGVDVRTHTQVVHFVPATRGSDHELYLSSGEVLTCSELIVSAGRLSSFHTSQILYTGLKAHISGTMENVLEMHVFPGGYAGISPVADNLMNMAILARSPVPKKILSRFGQQDWLEVKVPAFGVRKLPDWPRTYFIGDAAAVIPPITGEGLTLALSSGCLAAEYAVQGDFKGFKNAWRARYTSCLRWGKWLNTLLMQPRLSGLVMQSCKTFPKLFEKIYQLTRT